MNQLTLSLKLRQDVVTGFSYSFSRALLDRLKMIFESDELYEKYDNGTPGRTSELVENLRHYLSDQMPHYSWVHTIDTAMDGINKNDEAWEEKGKPGLAEGKEKIAKLIAQGYDFLSTFEKGQKGNSSVEIIDASTLKDVLMMRIEDMKFTARTFHCLKAEKITTGADLIRYPFKELLKLRNFGTKTLAEVKSFWERYDIDAEKFGPSINDRFMRIGQIPYTNVPRLTDSDAFKTLLEFSSREPHLEKCGNLLECKVNNDLYQFFTRLRISLGDHNRKNDVYDAYSIVGKHIDDFVNGELREFIEGM